LERKKRENSSLRGRGKERTEDSMRKKDSEGGEKNSLHRWQEKMTPLLRWPQEIRHPNLLGRIDQKRQEWTEKQIIEGTGNGVS